LAITVTTRPWRRLGRSGSRWWQIVTGWGAYLAYLESIEQRIGTVTLPGLGQVRLDDSFVPVRLRLWPELDSHDGLAPAPDGPTLSLAEALAQEMHILLVGPAGTGKSALLRWHAIESARAVRTAGRRVLFSDGGPPALPVYIPLAEATGQEPLEERAQALMANAGFEAAGDFLDTHLAAGKAVLLFDDLDTLPAAERRAAARRVVDLVARFPGNKVVVATRDLADQRWLPGFCALEVVGVDPSRIETLAERWGYGQSANTSGFLQVVERSPLVRSLVSRPGWLAAGLAGVSGTAEPIRAFDIVAGFVKHLDGSGSDVWPRLALSLHEAKTLVGRADGVPPALRNSGLLQWLSEDEVRFVHPAVQSYFAAAAAARDPAVLIRRAKDPWWEHVIVLAVGHMVDPEPLIESLLEDGHTALAALALAEARTTANGLRTRVQIELLDGLGHHGHGGDLVAAIGLASLLRLESVRHTGVVAPVLQALASGPARVRRAAAEALGRLGDPAAVAPLLSALGDPRSTVRDAASDALAAFGERTVQPLVRQLAVPNEEVRRAAIRALARQGSRAVGALVPLLDASSATARSEAAEALAGIGIPAVSALLDVLRGSPPEGNRSEAHIIAAADALTGIGRPAAMALIPLYADAGPAIRRRIVDILRAMGLAAVDALGEAVRDPGNHRSSTAAAMLGEMPSAGAAAAAKLMTALTDTRFEVRWEARRSLRRLGFTAMDVLLTALEGEDREVRWEAAQILLALPEPPSAQLTAVLAEALDTSDVAGRRRAVRALGALSGPAVHEAIAGAVSDPDSLVRRAAVAQLGRLGNPESLHVLVQRWTKEKDSEVALTILEALTELDPEAAVPTLIDALASRDARLCHAAVEILTTIGEPAVVPLVEALNLRPADLDLEGALRVLDRSGAQIRAGGRSPANLARVYHRMLVEPLDVEELVYLATTLEWWPPALELHRTFSTIRQFLDYTSLGGIGGAEAALEWVDGIETWLRPAAQEALRPLRLISQAVQYYNRGATRRSKERGLLAAADRLNTLRAMVGELGEPHSRVFVAAADHWGELINLSIRELQGKAELDLEVCTERVRIQESETAAVLVFELINRGEGLASNVQLMLSTDGNGLKLDSMPTHYLPPLGQGDSIRTEYTVRRHGAGVVPISLEARYDDPQTEGQTRRFVREVRFFVEEAEYREIASSPYIAGPPVKTPEMFYGRQSIFTWIQENLSGTYQDNVLVLYGERRTGKTSVLYQLQYHLPETYAFVLIDVQSIAYALDSTSDALYAMARKATNGLRRLGLDLPRPNREEYAEHPIEHFERLGESIGQRATETGRRAVLMTDEFDLLIQAVQDGQVSPYVFDCIRGLMQHQDGLSFIFAGAHRLSAMLKNPRSILFNTALRRKVSFLGKRDAERLIRQPVNEMLWYDDLALEKILRATAGHPYFIQYICHEMVNISRREAKNFVALRDVDRALQTTVQETTGIIRHAYMSLTHQEPVVLASVARITDDGRPFVGMDDINETLRQDGINLGKRELFETLRQLVERDFITERGGDRSERQYGFTMDLVRVWLEQNDEYARLMEERHA